MELKALKCPNCGAPMTVDESTNYTTCECCGSSISVNKTLREVARDAEINKLRLEERMRDRKHKEKLEEKREEWRLREQSAHNAFMRVRMKMVVIISTCLLLFAIGCVLFVYGRIGSNNQEAQLQTLLEEVMEDIDNGAYADAKIKAQKIAYAGVFSPDLKEKWDATRNEILDTIERAERESQLQAVLDEIRDCIDRKEFDIARKKAKEIKCSKEVDKSIQEKWETAKNNILTEIDAAEKQAKQDAKDAKKAEKEKEKQEKAAQKEKEKQEKAAQKEKEKQEKEAAQEESGEDGGILDWIKDKVS